VEQTRDGNKSTRVPVTSTTHSHPSLWPQGHARLIPSCIAIYLQATCRRQQW